MKKIIETIKRKWAAYLLEVIVIVGSILGAFALEQWGEERTYKQKEKVLLRILNQDFKNNKKQFDNTHDSHVKSLKAASWFIRKLPINENEDYNIDSVKYYFNELINRYTFNPINGSIYGIVESSGIEIITNDTLKNLIISWRDVVDDYTEDEQASSQHFREIFMPFMTKNTDLHGMIKTSTFPSGILDNQEFRNIITERYLYYSTIASDSENAEWKAVSKHIDEIIRLTAGY